METRSARMGFFQILRGVNVQQRYAFEISNAAQVERGRRSICSEGVWSPLEVRGRITSRLVVGPRWDRVDMDEG